MDAFTVTATITASPQTVYSAWLSSKGHTDMTGGTAKCSAQAGGAFTAWDGYITGKNLELVAGEKIVQTWRTTEFLDDDPDSQIELTLAQSESGTKLTLKHTGIPAGQGGDYKSGWTEFYFTPMKAYFGRK